MSIKFRLIGSIILFFLIIAAIFGATWIVTSSQHDDSLVINLAGRQRMLSQKLSKEVLAYAETGNEQYKKQSAATIAVFEKTLDALTDSGQAPLTLDPSGPTAVLPAASEDIRKSLTKVKGLWTEYKKASQSTLSSGKVDVAHLTKESVAVLKTMNAAVVMLQAESESRVTTLLITQGICVTLGAIIMLLILFNIQTRLIRPLDLLTQYAEELDSGNLDATLTGKFRGELLALKQAMTSMVASLKNTIEEVDIKSRQAEDNAAEARNAMEEAHSQQEHVKELLKTMSSAAATANRISQDVSTAVGQLAGQVDEVNHGTDVQRDRMAETATAMEEMNATVLEVAQNASHAAESAQRARENAETGAEGVRSAVSSIDQVKEQIMNLNTSMSELGEQAESIGQIMNVVTDIADQTNLLALNAAIEAARAGDAGRGFAVVADEVRKLAEKTMQATTEVGDAVNKIQTQARSNIAAVEKSVSDIIASNEAASESGQFMNEIVNIVQETAGQVESIATASEEQSAASEEINRAVTDVTQIATETADGMSQAARALDSMAAMTAELDAVIRDMTGDDPAPKAQVEHTPATETPEATEEQAPETAKPTETLSDRSGLKADDPKGLIQWADDLSVNIREIDEQHLRLINLINELQSAMASGKGKEAISEVLRELKEYTVFHFSHEEAMFEEHKYPGLLNHEAAHRKFVETVLEFEEQVNSGKTAVTMEVMNFLKDWLVKHIKGIDQKYSPFFNNKGIY